MKYWRRYTKKEQNKRFKEIEKDPRKHWKITDVDRKAQELWGDYTTYKEKMFKVTDTKIAPWHVIDANKKSNARLKAISLILSSIPYK